jgi:filamentous hemagglutinin
MAPSAQKTAGNTAAASTVGSTNGNVILLAGNTYRQVCSDIITPQGSIDISAKSVDIREARESSRTTYETKSKQSGLTISVVSPIISAIQTAQQMSEAAGNTSDSRMQLLAAANIGFAGKNASDAIKTGQGFTTDTGKTNQIKIGENPDGTDITLDANAADKIGGVDLNFSLGSSSSSSKTTPTSETAAGSKLSAGKDINITATGAGAGNGGESSPGGA